ncbi:hypothetical protein HZU77_009205 [Neisseriaceae bacterium TC5R-5]|nr:hypothetical protein [Neisseriaceae bacterium TC5R-5]
MKQNGSSPMLVFYCSHTFADFIEPHTQQPPLVLTPPRKNAELTDWLRDKDEQTPSNLWVWQWHLIEAHRKPCLLAMDVETRYVMLFTGLRQGDIATLTQQFIERLLNQQCMAAEQLGIATRADFNPMMNRLRSLHQETRFVLHSDRSVLAHINEVAQDLIFLAELYNGLPKGHEECGSFDEDHNRFIRHCKTRAEHFCPEEEMLCFWLQQFAGWTPDGAEHLRTCIENKRHEQWQSIMDEPELKQN